MPFITKYYWLGSDDAWYYWYGQDDAGGVRAGSLQDVGEDWESIRRVGEIIEVSVMRYYRPKRTP